ncbi:MAG: cytochrome c peroxidase [Thermoanaerobaculia bacterium]
MRPIHRSLAPYGAAVAVAFLLFSGAAARAQLLPPPDPVGNPTTPEKAQLGKVLFWDEQISSTRTVACGTCHIPTVGGEDPRSGVDPLAVHPGFDGIFDTDDDVLGSPGVPLNDASGLYGLSTVFGMVPQVTGRRTISPVNAAYGPELFWDGRAPGEFTDPVSGLVVPGLETGAALESQVVAPPVSDVEMAHVGRDWLDVVARIDASVPLALSPEVQQELLDYIGGRTYAQLFEEAFGSAGITAPRVAEAIAAYERTQFTDETPFDEFLGQGTGLTSEEIAGAVVFGSVAQCDNCHLQPLLSDGTFRYTGVRPREEDIGREEVTMDPADKGKMRVPVLRNVELRAPYMHDGRFDTLEEVVEFYDRGGDFDTENNEVDPLGLTAQQKSDLLAFLRRPLTDPRLAAGLPPFDRPTLYSESSRVPVVTGSGIPGSGGFTPLVVALEPALLGNPSFTVGVWSALGAAGARLVIDDHDPGLTLPAPASGDLVDEQIVLQGSGAGAGFGAVSTALPTDPSLRGADWFGRWYVVDPGAAGALAVSPLFRFETFGIQQQTAIFDDGFESGDTSAWDSTVN